MEKVVFSISPTGNLTVDMQNFRDGSCKVLAEKFNALAGSSADIKGEDKPEAAITPSNFNEATL